MSDSSSNDILQILKQQIRNSILLNVLITLERINGLDLVNETLGIL